MQTGITDLVIIKSQRTKKRSRGLWAFISYLRMFWMLEKVPSFLWPIPQAGLIRTQRRASGPIPTSIDGIPIILYSNIHTVDDRVTTN